MTRKLNVVLMALLLLAGAPFAWFLLDASAAHGEAKPLTITQLRRLAASGPHAGTATPVAIRYEVVARKHIVSDLLAAGSGLKPHVFALLAYQVLFDDGSTVALDRGLTRGQAKEAGFSHFDTAAHTRVERALAASALDLRLTGQAPPHAALESAAPYAASPGIVVIPTPGVNVGARMIYVRLADGREVLFAGDIAPIPDSWTQQRPPARLATAHLYKANRDEIAGWLGTIAALRAAAPALHIVAGHDMAVPRLIEPGFIDTSGHSHRPGRSMARSGEISPISNWQCRLGCGKARAIEAAGGAPWSGSTS